MNGLPIIIDRYMEAGTYSLHDGAIYADSMDTVEVVMNCEFLKSCGIACEPPRRILLPDLNRPLEFPRISLPPPPDAEPPMYQFTFIGWKAL